MRAMKIAFALLLSTLLCILLLEGAYRFFRYIKHGHVAYVFLDTVGGFCNHDVYGNAFMPNFDSTKLPVNIRFGEEGHGYGLDKVIKMNSRGFRTGEFLEAKKENTYRIITIGGSTTFCYGDNDKTWPAYLENALNNRAKKGSRFEVLNLGVGGWRSIEELLVFKNEVLFLNPDLVVLYTGWNDLGGIRDIRTMNRAVHKYGVKDCPNQVKNINVDVLPANRPSFIERNFLLYQQIKNRIIAQDIENPYDILERAVDKSSSLSKEWIGLWKQNIFEIIDTAKKHGISVIFIDYPCLARENADQGEKALIYQHTRVSNARYHTFWRKAKALLSREIHSMAAEKKVPVIEGEQFFERFTGQERVSLFIDEMHLSEKGNLVLGNYIARELSNLQDVRWIINFPTKGDCN